MLGFGSLFEANQTTFDYLMKLKVPISIALLEEDTETGHRVLISEKSAEWRYVLVNRSLAINHELLNTNPAKGPLGILKVNYQLVTKGGQKIKVAEEALENQIEAENKAVAMKSKSFFDTSQIWYNEYKGIKPDFAKRAVKIFGEHNTGVSLDGVPLKPLFTYITNLKLRGIDSPEHAARFVSLIPFAKPPEAQNMLTTWRYFHSFLAEGQGTVQDHATFLCSLFLGFGLDAYVCLGSCRDGAHCWVLTRTIEKVNCRDPLGRKHPEGIFPLLGEFNRH